MDPLLKNSVCFWHNLVEMNATVFELPSPRFSHRIRGLSFVIAYFSFSLVSSKQTHNAAISVKSTFGATVTKYCSSHISLGWRLYFESSTSTKKGSPYGILVCEDLPDVEETP